MEWRTVPGEGVLYSYSVHYRPAAPEFQSQVPYIIGLVQLDRGPRLLSRILGEPSEMAVGRRVRVVFEQVENGWAIPYFEVVP
ncbi:MAG: OB-fold domain-containing protein [Firmicutes bacterium]|nr:OB-fold domain-containing protein [Bacillota bacterium]